ncbi:MAG: molybdopterin-dependent oxidoreductase, partial [Nitrospinota bacterium]
MGNPVGGGQVGNALWRGVPLRALLERAGAGRRTLDSVAGR